MMREREVKRTRQEKVKGQQREEWRTRFMTYPNVPGRCSARFAPSTQTEQPPERGAARSRPRASWGLLALAQVWKNADEAVHKRTSHS